MRQNCS